MNWQALNREIHVGYRVLVAVSLLVDSMTIGSVSAQGTTKVTPQKQVKKPKILPNH